MDTKQITVTLTLEKKFESLHALEMAIHAEGQRIKQQLFGTELQAVIDEEKRNVIQKPLACPDCEKKQHFLGKPTEATQSPDRGDSLRNPTPTLQSL